MTLNILITIAVVVFTALFIFLFSLKKIVKKRVKSLLDRFQDQNIIEYERFANCLGIESKGLTQIRGNGVLILSEQFIFFQMLIPKNEILIPVKDIRRTEIAFSHLGKTKGRKLLKIIYTNTEGRKDAIAFVVNNLDIWMKKIKTV